MDDLVNEFVANQQIVLLDEIGGVSGHEDIYLPDFVDNAVNGEYEPFTEIENIESSNKSANQFHVMKNPESSIEGVNHVNQHQFHAIEDQQSLEKSVNRVKEHQFHIIKNRNGVRHMKFRKPKKVPKTFFGKKLVHQIPQQCTFMSCRAAFTSKTQLKKHMQEHAFVNKHRCDVCFEEFNVLENLTLHASLHSGDGQCPQCGKTFRRSASLEGHIKTHFKSEFISNHSFIEVVYNKHQTIIHQSFKSSNGAFSSFLISLK